MYVPKRGNAEVFPSATSSVVPALKSKLSTAKKGDKILVDDIQAIGPGGIKKRLNPIVITVI